MSDWRTKPSREDFDMKASRLLLEGTFWTNTVWVQKTTWVIRYIKQAILFNYMYTTNGTWNIQQNDKEKHRILKNKQSLTDVLPDSSPWRSQSVFCLFSHSSPFGRRVWKLSCLIDAAYGPPPETQRVRVNNNRPLFPTGNKDQSAGMLLFFFLTPLSSLRMTGRRNQERWKIWGSQRKKTRRSKVCFTHLSRRRGNTKNKRKRGNTSPVFRSSKSCPTCDAMQQYKTHRVNETPAWWRSTSPLNTKLANSTRPPPPFPSVGKRMCNYTLITFPSLNG